MIVSALGERDVLIQNTSASRPCDREAFVVTFLELVLLGGCPSPTTERLC